MTEGEGVHDAGRPLRVLLVIKCLGYGGAEKLLVDMVAARNRREFEYEVAYVLDAEHALAPAVSDQGAPVHSLGAKGNGDLRWMGRFRSLLRDGHFDVVHFHLPYAAGMGRLVVRTVPRRLRPKVVYTEHSLWGKTAGPVKAVNRATIGLDSALVVVSDAARDALPRRLRPRAEVLVHGVDVSKADTLLAGRESVRAEVRAELGVADDEIVVVAVSNLRAEKGYDILLEAARLTDDGRPPLRFVAVGRGPLAAELEMLRDRLGLGARFQFLGQRADVLRLLVGSDVFVMPSRHEGMPVALMEAMSASIAIVASAVGGVPQVVSDEVEGLLVPSERPDALAAALQRLAADPELRRRLGDAAKERSAMFDVTRASRRIEEIYRRVAEAA